ncbi:MAG TPA: hypothetical protein PK047_06310 [Saprospiraceae bacterium]|jgi:hypothetical protein|nr:hypothetical protein [Saprospiraceae bacterium]HRO08463.1 hypothetical protein [Saprospiraceae bacterium]HRP41848.1 hypothetical protein [Saprospiraceae bacterium]
MKKFLILGLFATLSFVACKNAETTTEEAAPAATEEVAPAPAATEEAAPAPAATEDVNAAPAEGTQAAPAENK